MTSSMAGRAAPIVYRTINELLIEAAGRDPDKIWLRTDDVELTFAEALAAIGGRAHRLAEHGVGRGDLVLFTARNTAPYLLTWLAVASLGAIVVPANPASTGPELAGLIGQAAPMLILTDDGLRELVTAANTVGAPVLDVNDIDGPGAELSTGVSPDDIAVLIPTSGTTGRSKLVSQTHRALVLGGEGFPFWNELTADDRMMATLPLFHINAPVYSTLGSLACGAGLILAPRFSASGFLDTVRRHGATQFNMIGAMLEILMRQPERADDADTTLRLAYTGPSPERERQLEFEARFGLRVVCGYGMSESPYGLIWPRGSRPFGALGTLRQHPSGAIINAARVVDDEGNPVTPGSIGELMLRNPTITPGYWQMPVETAATITEDGWLHTGDLVTEGDLGTDGQPLYTFVSRKKEVLRRRGENLSPLEVEEVLDAHPSVIESAVIGVPSEMSEEEIKAFVVCTGPADFADLRAWAAQHLAAFKVPRYWQQIDALPRTPTQRIAKPQLPTGHPDGEFDAEVR